MRGAVSGKPQASEQKDSIPSQARGAKATMSLADQSDELIPG